MSLSTASPSPKLSVFSTPAEDDDANFGGSLERAIALLDKQTLLDLECQKEVESLNMKQRVQFFEVLNKQHPELSSWLVRVIWLIIRSISIKYPTEMNPLLQNNLELLWCSCGRCFGMCKPNERVCCGREKGNCLTDSKEFMSMLEEVQLEYDAELKNAPSNGKLQEDTRKLVYNRTYKLTSVGKEGVPNCVRCVARKLFPDPHDVYNGIIP